MTADVFRFLALFVTYAYHKQSTSSARPLRAHSSTPPPRANAEPASARRLTLVTNAEIKDKKSEFLSKRQIGNKILAMYTDLLCEKGNYSTIRKFGKTVTSKVGALRTLAVVNC